MLIKSLLAFLFIVIATTIFAQIPKSGTYTYNYCDQEYNKCIGKSKIKIKGNKIRIYAPAGLSGIKEGELFYSGTLYKRSGKWFILHLKKRR